MGKINEKELKEIFLSVKQGDNSAFEKLYNQYNKVIYGVSFSILKSKEDAEDVTQSVFAKLYTIDKTKFPISNEATWLYSVTKNESLNFLSKKNSNANLENLYDIEDTNNEINTIIDKDSYNRLISKLNDDEKEIISLRVIGKFSFDEIGKILNKPTGTVKWKYYKSVKTLRILLSNLGMSVISFVLGMITFRNETRKSNVMNQEVSDVENETIIEQNPEAGAMREDATESKKENNAVFLDREDQTQETIVVETLSTENTNYVGIGFMGISAIFFIFTIISSIIFIKYQLKESKKLSK